ncbi:glycoside hydrolase family 20 protein [Paenibacillus sp. MMS20-IR301]|uniref:beta-N-acetylhexosaminidase n=1 Tax=Paenibacillus sp. MMS20-IR301 TaxID=2895946 RepID=UPI0028E80C53|nr:glycoside hydrolase family 20 protein [Paenibacillus sp. MMS20-IR301]WNS44098.1 glycoside hydrolase family 20 protein [Paenibacillus sp. MMS20-IR301]
MDMLRNQEQPVPGVQEYKSTSGEQWRLSRQSRIVIAANARSAGNAVLRDTVGIVQEEFAGCKLPSANLLPVLHAEADAALPGDLVIELNGTGDTGEDDSSEGYVIQTGSYVQIISSGESGIMYGLRTVLQLLLAQGSIQYGTITDYPVMPERALHIDIGRKFYSAEWITDRIREMSRLRLNTLQLHFSENEGFRLMSTSHPEVTSGEHLTKEQVKEILHTAARYHIAVIPSLDSPGHLGYALRSHPEWLLRDAEGNAALGALDITNAAARKFVLELIDEYAELFAGSTHFHIGGDEFIDFGQFGKYPQLAEYAENVLNISGGTGVDTYIDYLNGIAEHLEAKGWTVRAWNDGLYRGDLIQRVQPKSSIQITYWTKWHEQMAPVETFIAKGHQVLNFNDAYFYYVLGENAGYKYPTAEKISSAWHPGLFPQRSGEVKQEYAGGYPPELIGCSFSIWSDKPDAQSQAEVADGIRGPLWAMAEKAWLGNSSHTG